jgi:hypothetical protein
MSYDWDGYRSDRIKQLRDSLKALRKELESATSQAHKIRLGVKIAKQHVELKNLLERRATERVDELRILLENEKRENIELETKLRRSIKKLNKKRS